MRRLSGGGEDLDRIAAAQLMFKRDNLPVDFGADTMIADFGMDRIRKIDWGRSLRQLFYNPLGCKHVYHIVKEIELDRIHELSIVRQVLMPLDKLMEPAEGLAVPFPDTSLFFIFPMRGDTVLC